MSAEGLRLALGTLGIVSEVEARDRLAVLRAGPDAARIASERARVVALAAEHGFTHVALEIDAPVADAAVPRD